MSKIITFPDGSVYVERVGTRWGRIKVETDQGVFPGNTVMARAVQDVTPPVGRGKGSTIPFNRDWFYYLDNFHTKPASGWLWTPHMVWFNRGFIGDTRNTQPPNADPEPVLECIAFPANLIRIIGETDTHYEIWALPTDERPSKYNPKSFNFKNFPWIFAMAQAFSVNGDIQKVGAGLDVYHMNVRKPNKRHWMYNGDVELFQPCPFTIGNTIIVDYMFIGVEIYGITLGGQRVPLLVLENNQYKFKTAWRCSQTFLVPPV